MAKAGIPESEIEEVARYYDRVISMMRSGVQLEDARGQLKAEGFPPAFETLSLPVLPDDEADWQLLAALIDYDPRPALEQLEVPILAVFGAEDPITPVKESVAVFREAVRPDLLQVEVFDGAGHRLEIGDSLAVVDGYFEELARFIWNID
jgi:pimeloyl-ACP methyl ester carboxylesterase